MWIKAALFWAGLIGASASGQVVEWETFRLPDGYTGSSRMFVDGAEVQRVDFVIDRDWFKRTAFSILPGLGVGLLEARLATPKELLILSPSSFRVVRSDRFARTHTDAGEADLTPFAAVRMIVSRSAGDLATKSEPIPGGITRITLSGAGIDAELDYQDDRILAYREVRRGDRFMSEVEYSAWKNLPSGAHAPTVIVHTIHSGADEAPMVIENRLYDLAEVVGEVEPPAFQIPPNFTVIDYIEGVTKRANGEVIAPINQEPEAEQRPGTLKQSERWGSWILTGLGVAFVLAAGLIWRSRRAA